LRLVAAKLHCKQYIRVDIAEPYCWCLVANVARETAHGDAGLDIQPGLKHFSPGAKLWVLPQYQSRHSLDRLVTIGRHRGSSRYIRIVTERRHLENFRVQGVYSPAVHHAMKYMPLWQTREEAEHQAEQWNTYPLEARLGVPGATIMVSDPPPMEMEHDGLRFYLARLNSRRATYSTTPPPTEPSI
jgi:hypothetical protein